MSNMAEPISPHTLNEIMEAFRKNSFWGTVAPRFENGKVHHIQIQFSVRLQKEAEEILKFLKSVSEKNKQISAV